MSTLSCESIISYDALVALFEVLTEAEARTQA